VRLDRPRLRPHHVAYQDLAAVVDTLRRLDLSRPVASLTPIGNIEG
jgi:RNA-splicing ligase RtcB